MIVPTFGNAKRSNRLSSEISQILRRENRTFEIVLVNDGSPDATWETIQRMNLSHPEIRGIDLMRNYGQHSALLAGIFNARFEVIVTLDDDFQTPPRKFPSCWASSTTGSISFMARETRNNMDSRETWHPSRRKWLVRLR